MTEFTVEAVLAPVGEEGWSNLRSVLDIIPGALLLEYPDEPTLVLPVEAEDPMTAAKFLHGLAIVKGLKLRAQSISPAPTAEDLGIAEEAPAAKTPAEIALEEYSRTCDASTRRLTQDARLIDA